MQRYYVEYFLFFIASVRIISVRKVGVKKVLMAYV